MRKLFKHKRAGKAGSVALESVLAGSTLVMVFIMIVGYFTYLYPRYMVDLEVQNLANSVKIEGKLTANDYEVFLENMEERGYDREVVRAGTSVTAKNANNPEAGSGIPPIADGTSLIDDATENINAPTLQRSNGQIVVKVNVPANSEFLGVGLGWFGSDISEGMKTYTVKRVTSSEAYLPKVQENQNGGG